MAEFYSVLTTIGKAALANAAARGTTVTLTEMAVGDGNGAVVSPTEDMTELVNEVFRAEINTLDVEDSATMRAELSIPTDQGGFYVREVGIYDDEGQLFAVANLPDTYKPALAEGAGRELTVVLLMEISDSDAVTLKIDPTIVLSSRQYVDTGIATHDGDDTAHPALLSKIGATDTIYIGCGAMTPSVTNGATPEVVEDAANGLSRSIISFAGADNDTSAEFEFLMPPDWDLGTILPQLVWAAPVAAAGDEIRFTLAAVAVNNGESLDVAPGAAVNIDDTVSAAGAMHTATAGAAMTVGGTPAAGSLVRFKLTRDFDYGAQPLADVVQGLGVKLIYGKV